MSFSVFTDGCSNLPGRILKELDIRVLPCSYVLDGVPGVYDGNIDAFDTHAYYDKLRNGSEMKNTLLNTHLFITHFHPELEQGRDVVYIGTVSSCCRIFRTAQNW